MASRFTQHDFQRLLGRVGALCIGCGRKEGIVAGQLPRLTVCGTCISSDAPGTPDTEKVMDAILGAA